MLVFSTRVRGVVLPAAAAVVCSCGIGACGDPDLLTDLSPEGAPEVLTVMVMNDPAEQLIEAATYCKLNDDKRPAAVGLPDLRIVQVCNDNLGVGADMVMDALPTGWYVRIVFDELLDPKVEELVEIMSDPDGDAGPLPEMGTGIFEGKISSTLPVTLTCGGAP